MNETVIQIIDDFIMDEIEAQAAAGSSELWDWDHLKQVSSHLLMNCSHQKIQNELGKDDFMVMKWLI